MASINKEKRSELIRSLRLDAGQAEGAADRIALDFYPVPEHARVLEPDVVLIVGARGAGKTKLKDAAMSPSIREAIVRRTPGLRAAAGSTEWRTGHPLHATGPDAHGWQRVATVHCNDRTALQDLWFAYLVRGLQDRLDLEARKILEPLLNSPGGDAEGCLAEFGERRVAALLAMDRLEASLQAKSESVFISYDELDTLFFSDWEAMGRIIRGLVAFWGGYSRRWRRIRAKIFLRTDFYQHHGDVAGADIAKLAASRVELSWSDRYLYAMLIKHVANISEDLFDYCRKAGIEFEPRDEVLGWLPKIIKAEDARPFVERMVGPYMGLTNKKGHSFTWILDHIRDGNGNASPRSLVLLFEFASELERASPRATGVQLLSPVSLRNALDKVSRWYVEQAKTSEFRWLDGVARRLQADREVPWQRRDLERLLRTDWDKSWHPTEDVRPPAESARELVDALVEFGIVRARGNELFDVPDLFLAGLDLVRRGGVRRN